MNSFSRYFVLFDLFRGPGRIESFGLKNSDIKVTPSNF